MTEIERQAIKVALDLLASAIEDGNDFLFVEMDPQQLRALAERVDVQ